MSGRHAIHPDDSRAFWFMDMSEMFEMVNGLLGIAILAGWRRLANGRCYRREISCGSSLGERTHEFARRPRLLTGLTLVAFRAGNKARSGTGNYKCESDLYGH